MLTLANFNTTQAKTYYKRENYYSQEEAQANSEWRGHGASKYQLSNSIDDLDAYENIVNGHSPDGKTQLRQKQSHKDKKERAGVDLTFSAPKSVSLACLVGGDSRLEEAHRLAVRRTIDLIEERYSFTRINSERVKTGNLTVAVWHHDTSRELDPHLHSHCLLMNCTQAPDGKWRTLSNEEFFRNKILLGQIYRNELALECRKLGYEIESHPKELFEIKGYTREQIEAFSKRHEQIKEKLAEIGVEETTENKIWAWRETRVKKNHEIDRQEMLPYWHEEADLYGIIHPLPEQNFHLATTQKEVEAELTTVVKAGIEHCSERKVAFKSEDIEKFVTAKTRPFGIGELQQAIFSHPELIKTFDGRYTTQSAWNRELATIRLMQQGKGVIAPITHPETIEGYLEDKTLTSGQREAVKVAATTTDSFIAWQGVAGAGKTYALSELKQITVALLDVAPGYAIKGFAPSAEAAKVLQEELGIEANTVARLLVSSKSEDIQPNQIWIVDEAGLLSAKVAHELLQRATEEQARVILVGDIRQLSAVEAGNPFKSLQQAGIQTAYLSESLRQKSPDLQLAVNLAAAGQTRNALAHLEQVGRLKEIPDIGQRTNRIATEYIKLAPEERQNTLIVAGTHKEQSAIVKEIRAALKQEGTLGYGVEAAILKALDLTKVQARYAHHYSVGDVVVPSREYRRSGLHKSQPYTIEAVVGDKLTLSDLAGNYLMVDPMKFRKSVYKTETSEIAVGDRLKWTRNDKELGRRNGQEFTVTQIEGQTATIEFLDGKTSSIDLSQPLHCDYALVSTTYSSQGKTAERVLISSTVDLTVSQESFYVAISRAKHDLRIFAEDREWMFEQAQHSNAQETALSLLPAPQRVESQKQPQATVAQPQLVLVQNPSKSKEQTHDFTPRQSKPEPRADSPKSSNRCYGSADRARYTTTNKPSRSEQENHGARNKSEQEFEQPGSKLQQFFEAINGYLEQQEVEQLGADIAEINRSLANGWLPGERAAGFPRAVERQNPASLDRTGSSRNIERQNSATEQLLTRQLLNALSDFFETAALAESPVADNLLSLTENLSLWQHQDLNRVIQKLERALTNYRQPETSLQALTAIAEVVEESSIAQALAGTVESVIGQLSSYPPQLSNREATNGDSKQQLLTNQAKSDQALKASASYVKQQEVLGAKIPQDLETLAEQDPGVLVNDQQVDLTAVGSLEPDNKLSSQQLLEALTQYIEQEAFEFEILPVLEDLTKQLTPLQPKISTSVEQLDTTISHILQQLKAVSATKQQEVIRQAMEALSNCVEHSAVEKALYPQDLQTLSNQLSQLGNPKLGAAMQQLEVTLAGYQVPDSSLILAEKAVQDYFATSPPQPPSLVEQQAHQLEIDKLLSRINRLWSKQDEQVELASAMQKNPFHAWNKKYDAQLKQIETTMQAISQSIAQKDQKQTQKQQWSKQTKTYQEWENNPQTQAMRQLATFLNLPRIQSRLEAIHLEQQQHVASKQIQREAREIAQAVKDMFMLTGTNIQPDGSLILNGKNWRLLQLGNTVSVTVKADNREILRVEGNKTTVFNLTPFERQKMHSFREEVQRGLQNRQQRQRESERKGSQELSL